MLMMVLCAMAASVAAAPAADSAGDTTGKYVGTFRPANATQDVMARVGADTITQKQFVDFEIASGQGVPVLNYLITESVITQEAKAQGVLPTDAEVSKDLAGLLAARPDLAKLVADHRDQYLRNSRLELSLANLLKKPVHMSPASQREWFKTHHNLFDEAARASVNVVFFDSMQKARQGQRLLAKGSSPHQVASSVGARYYLSGKASPMETREDLQEQYGPALSKTVAEVFQQKPGYTSQPIRKITVPGITGNKVAIVRLVRVTPPKPASLEANRKRVEEDMAMEAYAKRNLPFPLPPNMTAQQFDQLKRVAEPKFVQDLVQSYAKNNKITINNAELRDPIMKQLQAQPASGAGGAGASVPPPPPPPPPQ